MERGGSPLPRIALGLALYPFLLWIGLSFGDGLLDQHERWVTVSLYFSFPVASLAAAAVSIWSLVRAKGGPVEAAIALTLAVIGLVLIAMFFLGVFVLDQVFEEIGW